MGSTTFVSKMPIAVAAIAAASEKALTAACNEARNQIVQNLSGQRHGARYRLPDNKGYYTASAPGEYPAVRLGDLKDRIQYDHAGPERKIGTPLDYGLALEKKPPDKGGREWLRPSLEQARPAMLRELHKRWF